MKKIIARIRRLFPGKNFYLLILNVVLLFLVSLFDLLGVAAILPVIQIATGTDYTVGYLGVLYNLLGQPSQEGMVLSVSAILVLAFVFKGIFSLMIRWWSSGFLAKQQTASSVTLLEAYLNESYMAHRKRTTPEILQITGDANAQVYAGFIGGILSIVGEGMSVILLMGMLIFIMPFEAIIALVYFVIAAFILQKYLKSKNENAGYITFSAGMKASEATLSAVNGFRENKLHGMVDRRLFDYQSARLAAVEANRRRAFYQDLPKYMLELVFIVGIALILGLILFTKGVDGAANLVIFAGACIRILPNFIRLTGSLGVMRTAYHSLDRYEHAMDEMQANEIGFIDEDPEIGVYGEVSPKLVSLNVDVENLRFRYPDGDVDVLKNINFSIPSGTSIAFIGGSGSGKTTLVDLILGLLQPSAGDIKVNGESIHHDLPLWQQYIGYVPQDVFLTGKTIREEIAFGFRPEEIDDSRVWECLEIAEMQDVINSLEDGLDTVIGERGTRLSGGQRQRLGIARAIYRNPSVLVLDEATSALDNETEHKITQTINRLAKDITVIIVAHRLSTVRDVDQLLFMSKGTIVSQGTFSQVRAENEEFARLVELGQLPE